MKETAALQQLQAELSDENCDAASTDDITCSAQFSASTFELDTIATYIDSAGNSKATNYLGTPPAEIASLYRQTKAAADAAAKAGSAWGRKCVASSTARCLDLAEQVESATDDLDSELSAWQPYE